jgi:ribosomal-protein-alanine N-acetyltransferase
MIGPSSNMWHVQNASELLAIGIEPENQGLGLGEKLMGEVEKKAFMLEIKRLFLHTASKNYPALSLFAKAGFKPWGVSRKFYPEGQDAVVMSKEVAGGPGPG